MEIREFLVHAHLDDEALEQFIAAGWLTPRRQAGARRFSEIDLVRARLIRDLRLDLGVNDDGISIILDLIDQMHGLRRTLRCVLSAVGAQPQGTRARIIAEVRAVAAASAPPRRTAARRTRKTR